MSRKDFQCVFCFFLLFGRDQCVWPSEASKLPAEVESEAEDSSVAESMSNPHFHRLPPPHPGHMMPQMPPQTAPGHPPLPSEFYPHHQRPYYRQPEDDTLHEMKQTVASFSSMQKQFLNSLKSLQESQNSPPIVELPINEDERRSRIAKDTQVSSIRDVIGKVTTKKKKQRPATTTTVVQTIPQPVQTPLTTFQGLNVAPNLRVRNLLDRTFSVSHAERTFDGIKSDMIDALWTGLTVAAVKLAPLILMCIRLIFKAILPLVGMSLLNRTGITTQDVPAVQFLPVVASDTTTTVQQDVELEDDTSLDEEFENIKRNFYK